MSTAILHADIQRSRFIQHALAALTGLFGAAPRTAPTRSPGLEAQKVRELAYSYSKTDPGFAADLYAAAARHEGLDEV